VGAACYLVFQSDLNSSSITTVYADGIVKPEDLNMRVPKFLLQAHFLQQIQEGQQVAIC